MSLSSDNLHVDLRAIDNVCTIVGGEDPITVLENYVVDVLGGKMDYLDLAGTSYDTGTGQVTGNITFGGSIWTVTTGTAYVRTIPGSSFPYLEVPDGSIVTQDVAGTVIMDGTDSQSTEYFLDQLYAPGATTIYYMWHYKTFGEPNVRSTGLGRNIGIGSNMIAQVNIPVNVWHTHRRRIKWDAGIPNWVVAAASTYDGTTDGWLDTTTLGAKPDVLCSALYGGGGAGGANLFACHIRILNDTVAAGTDDTIKTLLRNATKLPLLGGIWPT